MYRILWFATSDDQFMEGMGRVKRNDFVVARINVGYKRAYWKGILCNNQKSLLLLLELLLLLLL